MNELRKDQPYPLPLGEGRVPPNWRDFYLVSDGPPSFFADPRDGQQLFDALETVVLFSEFHDAPGKSGANTR